MTNLAGSSCRGYEWDGDTRTGKGDQIRIRLYASPAGIGLRRGP
jgi:hypothetical protein